MTAPVFRPNFEKALKDVHDRVKILEAVPSGGTISTDAILFNNANTSLPSRGLVVVANDHNVSVPFPGSGNRPGIALVSSDSYGMLLQATSASASIRTVADLIRNQITDLVSGGFLVETSTGTRLFEVTATGGFNIPLLTGAGDLPFSLSGGVLTRLGIGTTDQVLTVAGGSPAWANGSKKTLTTTGDILYASAANTLARRAIGSAGDVLTVAGGVPTWAPTIGYGASSGTSFTINVSSFGLIQAGAVTNWAIGATDIANTLDSGATFTVYDSGGNPILRMTEGSPNLHIKTGGTVIADL